MLKNIAYKLEDAEFSPEILAYKIFDDGFEYLLLHNLAKRTKSLQLELTEEAIIYFLNKNVMPFSKKIRIPGFQSIMIKTPLKNS